MIPKFALICNAAAASCCLTMGYSVREVAKKFQRDPATIRHWLRRTGLMTHRKKA